jgi:spermidine synthase
MDMDLTLTSAEVIYGLMACALAIALGAMLARKQAQAFGTSPTRQKQGEPLGKGQLPGVNFFDYGDMRFLHLGTPAVQGSMKISKPFDIHLEYQQRMMGWLLFADLDRVQHLHAMQLGLGAASLTKFCYLQLGMQTSAVELNPEVLNTCRLWFHLPQDNAKLRVVLADAAEAVGDSQWHGKVDALQVDLYDQEAARPVCDSQDFYRHCRQLLTDEGCMAVNLFGRAHNVEQSMQNITVAFGAQAVWQFKPTHAGNTIVLALKKARPLDKSALASQAQAIQTRWPLPAVKWVNSIAVHS